MVRNRAFFFFETGQIDGCLHNIHFFMHFGNDVSDLFFLACGFSVIHFAIHSTWDFLKTLRQFPNARQLK